MTVSQGNYAVLLGDTGLRMRAIEPAVFGDHDNVRLRVWFSQTAVGPYQRLSPDHRIASVGYAMVAATATDFSGSLGGDSYARHRASCCFPHIRPFGRPR